MFKKICHSNRTWKWRVGLAWGVPIISALSIAYSVRLVFQGLTNAEILFALSVANGLLFCFGILFTILCAKSSTRYMCGLPYTSYANGSLLLEDDTLQYIFWLVTAGEPGAYSSERAVYAQEYKSVYRIKKRDIYTISFDEDICRIEGAGILQTPGDEEGETEQTSKPEFSFVMAFEQDNPKQIIEDWWKGHN